MSSLPIHKHYEYRKVHIAFNYIKQYDTNIIIYLKGFSMRVICEVYNCKRSMNIRFFLALPDYRFGFFTGMYSSIKSSSDIYCSFHLL